MSGHRHDIRRWEGHHPVCKNSGRAVSAVSSLFVCSSCFQCKCQTLCPLCGNADICRVRCLFIFVFVVFLHDISEIHRVCVCVFLTSVFLFHLFFFCVTAHLSFFIFVVIFIR